MRQGSERVVVVGAGMGGLAAAIDLAAAGRSVVLLERADGPGGKMRQVSVGGLAVDAGPTVFTLRSVFDGLFERAGARLDDHLTLAPAEILARHAWGHDARMDLFADLERSVDAIGVFAGAAEARRFRGFCGEAAEMYRVLGDGFMFAQRPSLMELTRRLGARGLVGLARNSPFSPLWQVLGKHFKDPRLRQLFGRYSTYCGSSPFEAPATLMVIAHVEQAGVWMVEGGMGALARALADLAGRTGVEIRYGAEVASIEVTGGAVSGVALASGERIEARSVVFTGDTAAIAAGLLGRAAAGTVQRHPSSQRSLSALATSLVGRAGGFPLVRHTVFFSADYRAEFDDLVRRRRLPSEPTTYVCAQDRGDDGAPPADGRERFLTLVNAPALGDTDADALSETEIQACQNRAWALLRRAGLDLEPEPGGLHLTSPKDFHRLFPGTGGALYGRANHGWKASFERPAARTRLPGLYLAGGSAHPSAGVPMAATSGRLAVEALLADQDRSARRGSGGGSRSRRTA